MINNLKKIKENKNILCGTKLLLFIILFFYLVKNIIYLDFKENILLIKKASILLARSAANGSM